MKPHHERHRTLDLGWLRAAVLGANDGIVSTASVVAGVAAAAPERSAVLIAGVASLVGGALSMAAGEYVSVASQADAERADLERERRELATNRDLERDELAGIYVARGVEAGLAREVAEQLMAHDALAAHARDELGMSDASQARPFQAAAVSAVSFAVGAALPVATVALAPLAHVVPIVIGGSLLALGALGALAARAGGARAVRGTVRVLVLGALAMATTAAIGAWFGTVA